MKGISTITNILKVVVKYGAMIAVAVKVIQYAHDEFSKLNQENETPKIDKKDGEIVSEQS
ncbi:hypothetical protein [Flavobacterium saccharophilum]|uniref:Uncharacterized protein n=1 Tax=Flavobacterium saccharophilum TaxID=29534 RepID=A0A1M7CTC9_9FLAO|nr:hypothetical protein [Flavobacterium saccharophilum]SHL70430.1 hypothetical protein SAMN05444366_1271 [Flavobacterium saccharophilum]